MVHSFRILRLCPIIQSSLLCYRLCPTSKKETILNSTEFYMYCLPLRRVRKKQGATQRQFNHNL